MRPIRTALPLATVAAAALLATGAARAQDTNSATDATGAPVEAADGLDVEQTDGLIRYGDADSAWETLSGSDDMGAMASERWPEIEPSRLGDVGDKDSLVALVAESYGIDEQAATREVDAWVMETADGM